MLKVGFPTTFDLTRTDDARVFVCEGFFAGFVNTVGANGSVGASVFLNSPGSFAETPTRVSVAVENAVEADGEGEVAARVNNRREGEGCGEGGGGKDSDGVFIRTGEDGTGEVDGVDVGDFVAG